MGHNLEIGGNMKCSYCNKTIKGNGYNQEPTDMQFCCSPECVDDLHKGEWVIGLGAIIALLSPFIIILLKTLF